MSSIKFDAEAIRLLANILTETGLTEIEISEKDSRIRVVRAPALMVAQTAYAPAHASAHASAGPATPAPPAQAAPADLSAHPGAVKSPMVGVAYLSAEPGSPPFVVPGQAVTEGQTLLLIEAMKTFNQIKAPRSGTILRILVHAGAPVEYGEVLIVLDA